MIYYKVLELSLWDSRKHNPTETIDLVYSAGIGKRVKVKRKENWSQHEKNVALQTI